MPWTPAEATKHTKKANSPRLQAIWAEAANRKLEKTGDEGLAVRAGNSAVKKIHEMHGVARQVGRRKQ